MSDDAADYPDRAAIAAARQVVVDALTALLAIDSYTETHQFVVTKMYELANH